jgi:TM2 domain-containing membrane protein YozV
LSVRERDPYLCAAGSFFFPGLGQVYCGRTLRGIVFLIPAVLLTIPYALISLSIHFSWFGPLTQWLTYWSSLVTIVSKIIDFLVRIIATYDAYNVAKLIKAV